MTITTSTTTTMTTTTIEAANLRLPLGVAISCAMTK